MTAVASRHREVHPPVEPWIGDGRERNRPWEILSG